MDDYERGVYGLHNAVKEIKDVKAQLTIRDADVAGMYTMVYDVWKS